MLVLGIETSCDETAFALVKNGKFVGEALASQADVHSLFGGVVPELASREHYRILGPLFDNFMQESGVCVADLSGIAVARGPGLLGSLLIGVAFAKALAFGADVPLVGVDHLRAHLLAPGLETELELPALGLLVSGGHTHIYYIKSPFEFELLGKTLDDAAGEAFDKVAKMLGLPYPGGRYLDFLAQKGEINKNLFPCPYLDNTNFDFSFSGLKTSVYSYLEKNKKIAATVQSLPPLFSDLTAKKDFSEFVDLTTLCASFNYSVVNTLLVKIKRALMYLQEEQKEVKSLIVAGGVAANTMLRGAVKKFTEEANISLLLPSFSLCTDNAAMIAYTGYLMLEKGLTHNLDLEAIPRGKVIPDDAVRVVNLKNSLASAGFK